MKQKVYNLENKQVSEAELSDYVFAQPLRVDILSRVIEWQLAKRRSGAHKTKEIAEISGSTKKIVRQKGSGGARHGSKRAPQFRGGAVIFGPVVRSHGYSLQKKVRNLGLRTALSEKLRAGDLIILDSFKFKDCKTKTAKAVMDALSLNSAIVIDDQIVDMNAKSALSNLEKISLLPAIGANVYDIMRHDKLVVTVEALKSLEARLK